MRIGVWIDMCTGTLMDLCVGMWIGMCADMNMDLRIDYASAISSYYSTLFIHCSL